LYVTCITIIVTITLTKYTNDAYKPISLAGLGCSEADSSQFLGLVAGILHLGQVLFEGIGESGSGEGCRVADRAPLELAANLMGKPYNLNYYNYYLTNTLEEAEEAYTIIVTIIDTIIDTIIQTNYTNDAY
jgi:hypothetical protein